MATAGKTVVELDAEREALVREWIQLEQQIEGPVARIAAIRAELEAMPVAKYQVPGTDAKVDVSQGRTFKPELFSAKYPPAARPDLYKAVPDAAKIKKELAPAEVLRFTVPNKPSVKLV